MTDTAEEYRTLEHGAGWVDRRPRGRIRFSGADAAAFLHALVTNDVLALSPGQGAYTTYLTPQGRLISDLDLYRRADGLLAGAPPGLGRALTDRFDRLIFSEDVQVADVSDETAELGCLGAAAAPVLASIFGVPPTTLGSLPEGSQADTAHGFIARSGDALLPSYRAFFPAADWPRVVSELEASRAVPLSPETSRLLRIEAGRPEFATDMTEETIPLEAGLLDRAISTSKGCYVGQEIIVRILHRGGGRVARRLVQMAFAGRAAASIVHGTPLDLDGREIGRVTSIAFSPRRGDHLALGYVSREAAETGVRVDARSPDGSVPGEVVGFAH